MFRKLAISAVFMVITSPQLMALGLGEIDMQSALNQPMRAVIDLTSSSDTDPSSIKVSVASLEAHQRAGLTKSQVLSSFRFSVEKGKNGNAEVVVTSTDTIREPYIEFLLELEWPKGRLLRQYTVLVDPPVTMPAVVPAPAPAVVRQATPAPARVLTSPVATAEVQQPVTTTVPATAAAPAPAPAGDYGPIQRSETLWSVAERVRPDTSVSMYQVMQALLAANPDAFLGNNINRMKAGVTLKVPSLEEMRNLSARDAFAESSRQYHEWQAVNNDSSAQAATASEQSVPAAPEEPPPVASTGDAPAAEARLSLTAPEGDSVEGQAVPGESSQAGTEPGEKANTDQQLALATEEAEASRAQSAELQSRVQELEQQVNTMKRLLELKDHALAQLQNRTAAGEEAAQPAPQAENQSTAAPEAAPASTFFYRVLDRLMANPLLTGGVALVALLLAMFFRVANRHKGFGGYDDDMTLEKHLAEQGDKQHKQPPTVNVRESSEGSAYQQVTGHENDPLTEADVYLAYGRVQQAEDLLRTALRDEPDNEAMQIKLLEVLHAAGNASAFNQAASEYRDGVDEHDERWLKIAAWGLAMAPENDLYRAARPVHAPDSSMQDDNDEKMTRDLPDSMEFSLDDYSIDIEDEQEGVLTTDDEITTKLDLARAYIDMDDQESARNILDEVIEEGNTDQKQEAQRIIARLA